MTNIAQRAAQLLALAALLAGAPGVARAAGVHLGYQADTLAVAPRDTFLVELKALQADASFNAFDASVLYDGTKLRFAATTPLANQRGTVMTSACPNHFHLFSPLPDSLAITLVILCNQVTVTGPGQLYKVKFVADSVAGWTRLRFGGNTQFFLGGTFANPLETRDMVVKIGNPVSVGVGEERAAGVSLALAPPLPNPSRGGRGVTVAFALPREESVTVELLDTLGRRVAARAPERYAPGAIRFHWALDGLAPGRYLLRARTASGSEATRSWIVLR